MNFFPGSEYVIAALFLICAVTTAVGALIATLTTRIIRSVCGLAICCVGLAGLYYYLHSPFLALMEILIYVGAVCVTIIFAVMLAEPEEPASQDKGVSKILWGGTAFLVGGLMVVLLGRLGLGNPWSTPAVPANDGSVEALGTALLTTYSLAFELISLVLLVAILGALAIARMGRHKT